MKRVTGGGLPADLWSDMMTVVHAGKPSESLIRCRRRYRDQRSGGTTHLLLSRPQPGVQRGRSEPQGQRRCPAVEPGLFSGAHSRLTGVRMDTDVLDTLKLALDGGGVTVPETGDVLFLRAEPGPVLPLLPKGSADLPADVQAAA